MGAAALIGSTAARRSDAARCTSSPSNYWRHVYICPELIRYLHTTSVGVRSDPRLAATISRFCSAVHERRGSARVRISAQALGALQ